MRGKKIVTSQADLPRFTYPVKGSASELVQAGDTAFNLFASRVRTDHEIVNKAPMRSLLQAKINLQYLAGDYLAALGTIASLGFLPQGARCPRGRVRLLLSGQQVVAVENAALRLQLAAFQRKAQACGSNGHRPASRRTQKATGSTSRKAISTPRLLLSLN
jgi:hypothetical protein